MIVRELLTRWGFNVDQDKVDRFNNAIQAGKAKAQGLETALRSIETQARVMGKGFDAARAKVDAVRTEIQRLADQGVPSHDPRLVALGRQYQDLQAHIGRTHAKSRTFFGSMLKGAAMLAAGWISFQTAFKAASFVVDTNREFERLNASLVTVTGSEANAKQAFGMIEKFAAKTPYNLGQVVEAFIKLKALGLDPSQDALTSYGNTASSMGKPLMQMIEAVADASTMEFERLKEFGIKARQQTNSVSFTFRGVTTTVAKDAKSIEKYLRNLGKVQFAGAMDRQARTLNGIMSNIGDNLGRLARKVGASGLWDALKRGSTVLQEWTSGGDEAAAAVGSGLGRAIDVVVTGIQKLVNWANKGAEALGGWRKVAKLAAAAVWVLTARLLGLGAIQAVAWITKTAAAFRTLAIAEGLAAAGAKALNTALAIGIGWIIPGIILVLQDLYTYLQGGDSQFAAFWQPFVEWIDYARQFWSDVVSQIKLTFTELAEFVKFKFQEMVNKARSIKEDIVNAFNRAYNAAYNAVVQWIDAIKAYIKTIPGINLVANVVGALNGGPQTVTPASSAGTKAAYGPPSPGGQVQFGDVHIQAPPGADGRQMGQQFVSTVGSRTNGARVARLGNPARAQY